tara:strand:+ start:32 stop:1375 length:1344 start_codon:yes stop_codon:yes gene_type:complete
LKNIYSILIILLFTSCDLFDANEIKLNEKVYVALQGEDQVGIVDIDSGQIKLINIDYSIANCSMELSKQECIIISGCEWMEMGSFSHCISTVNDCLELPQNDCLISIDCDWMEMGSLSHCMELGAMMDMGAHTPHFIAIDEINRYWFVTTINSGYIGRYNLDTDEYIDNIKVGDSPALMVLDENKQRIYVSRMMPMSGMMTGAVSTIVQSIDFNSTSMTLGSEFIIDSPAPHGIDINSDGSNVYVASNTADYIYKLDIENNSIHGASMDSLINIYPNVETQRLKPIQCLSLEDSLLVITCSGGLWFNPFSGLTDTISGQIQLWSTPSMTLIDTLKFSWNSSPWHSIDSKIDREFYVVLAGDNLYEGSSGVACITYEGNNLSLKWENYSSSFKILHGIDVSNNHGNIYVSGRGDGNLHVLDISNGKIKQTIPLGEGSLAGGIKAISLE